MTVTVEFGHLQVGVLHFVNDVVGDGAAVFRAVGTGRNKMLHEARVLLALLIPAHVVQAFAPRDEVVGAVDEHGVVGRAGALQLGRVSGQGSRKRGEREQRRDHARG